MTQIIYIHGFKGSYQSDKVQYLQDAFPDADVYGFPVPERAMDACDEIDLQLNVAFAKDDDVILVGTSLGAFWSQYFANKYALKSVLINICVNPAVSLRNMADNERAPDWRLEYAAEYQLFVDRQKMPNYPCIMLLEEGDELFDSAETARIYQDECLVKLLPGGNHRFTNYPEMVTAVKQLRNNESL